MTDPFEPLTPATPTGAKPKPHRHWWGPHFVSLPDGPHVICERCGKVRDEAASRRGRLNRSRGLAIQRRNVREAGMENVPGNAPNLDGRSEMFRAESKSGGAFPERLWRWLRAVPVAAGQIPLVIVRDAPGPGIKSRAVVVIDLDDWHQLHGD